jgi:hypothetical protein
MKGTMTLNEAIKICEKTDAARIEFSFGLVIRGYHNRKELPEYQIWDGEKFHEGVTLLDAVQSFLKDNPLPGTLEPTAQDLAPIVAEMAAHA